MSENKKYQVLARKYRPKSLDGLIGQDVLVQTLTNAITNDRIPHAFIMTGIRGVGKTSTARIIARSLLCIGKNGKIDKPTTTPCGECEQCLSIENDRHVDVLEVDAASRTGVNDIREIIENVSYAPVMGRYKIYIIDEVHMLSKSAFNALLKTLEEPPEHTKFIFATTEIRKIPVTVLSRCMRFDLARVSVEQLIENLADIAKSENAKIDKDALILIAHASGGSVRDAQSLLDQAIGIVEKGTLVEKKLVARMLGLADSSVMYNLFSYIVQGKAKEAIEELREVYMNGAEPLTVLQELLEMSHFITQLKVIPDMAKSPHLAENDIKLGQEHANKLAIPYLARMWQMLLKGVNEVQTAPNGLVAAEMVLVRLAYASDMPTPDDLIKKIQKGETGTSSARVEVSATEKKSEKQSTNANAYKETKIINKSADGFIRNPIEFSELVELFKAKGEGLKYGYLIGVNLVSFDANSGRVEFNLAQSAPPNFAGEAAEMLSRWTGNRWMFVVSNAVGEKSLRVQQQEALAIRQEATRQDPAVQIALKAFPGARITKMNDISDQPLSNQAQVIDLKTNKGTH